MLEHGIISRLVASLKDEESVASWRRVVEAFVPYVQIIQIIISIALIAVILAQAKGAGGLGGIFGGDSTVYRTRRGAEKTLFNVTVGLALAFFAISLASVLIA
jgi:preprotein translocase subunit SecG